MECCRKTAEAASQALNVDAAGVLVGSTGVIGMQMPVDRIEKGIHMLAAEKKADRESGAAAARAIYDDRYQAEEKRQLLLKSGERQLP